MNTKQIAHDFRISFKLTADHGPVVCIRKWYRVDEESRPGLPGMELSKDQFEYLAQMKDKLEDYAIRGTRAQCMLGGNRQVMVQDGDITLWHYPFVLGPVVALRHSLRLPTQLWRDLWQNERWILDEFSALNNAEQDQGTAMINTEQDQETSTINADQDQGMASTPTPAEVPDPDTVRSWWLGAYPVDPEELPAWVANLTQEQLMACPDRQPAPWDDFWDAWQAVQTESRKRLAAADQPTARKRARKSKD